MRPVSAVCLALLLAHPARADVDPCLVGTWTAINSDLEAAFEDSAGGGTASAEGQMLMVIGGEGSLVMHSNDLSLNFETVGRPPMLIRMTGQTVSTLATSGNRYVTGGVIEAMEAVAEVEGQSVRLPGPPEGYRTSGLFACNDAGLALSPDGPPDGSPRLWRRTP